MNIFDMVSRLTPAQLEQLAMMQRAAPFRFVWGGWDQAGTFHVFASYDRRQMREAVREGWSVFEVKKV